MAACLPLPPVLRGERAGVRGDVHLRRKLPLTLPSPPEYRGRGERADQFRLERRCTMTCSTILRMLSPAILLLSAATCNAAELRVGAASVIISPPLGTPMAGYYS